METDMALSGFPPCADNDADNDDDPVATATKTHAYTRRITQKIGESFLQPDPINIHGGFPWKLRKTLFTNVKRLARSLYG